LIETDQAIAVKVLKLANSAFYVLSGKVTSIQHAAVILEYKTLGELITITAFSGLMGKNYLATSIILMSCGNTL
jgi:HD-like signal output (HDOD) protein